jgi:plastocyanin
MRMKPPLMSVVAAGLIVGLTGCGSSTTTEGSEGSARSTSPTSSSSATTPATQVSETATSAPEAKSLVIAIKDFKYTVPASVAPGTKVTVKNEDAENHTMTSAPKGAFEVTATGGGGTATLTAPTKPGSYPFTCDFHADMMGTLVVR